MKLIKAVLGLLLFIELLFIILFIVLVLIGLGQ
jgi:hypothetical protein